MTQRSGRNAVVVGAGPVGCLAAISLARSGWNVRVYEGRPDTRLPSSKAAAQRSINLAISARGIAAIESVDPAAASRFLQTVIPMRGRMIHDARGNTHSQLYDKDGQCINSIDRALLNDGLLDEASAVPNIRIFFSHKVQSLDFDQRKMLVRDLNEDKDIGVDFDFCVGADGSFSVVRRQLMRVVRMDYQQEYIPHEYIELKMPAGLDKDCQPCFLLDPSHLHIWPRHSFMLIALPNKDKTFTCTLFAPTAEFDHMGSPEMTLMWFKFHFPDAVSVMGEQALLRDFERNPRSPLISTKLKPYHYKDRAILLGDAAHSMVPFYGQGLNCGLEDVRVLQVLLREGGVESTADALAPRSEDYVDQRLAQALARYSDSRHEDVVTICDLAMDNYVEMRHSVTTPTYLFRKTIDNFLFSLSSRRKFSQATLGPLLSRVTFPSGVPNGWIPMYTMVTFRPDISYATAKRVEARQSRILTAVGCLGTIGILAIGWQLSYHLHRRG